MDALLLMNAAAVTVVEDMADIVFAYGVSDEYRYAFLLGSLGFEWKFFFCLGLVECKVPAISSVSSLWFMALQQLCVAEDVNSLSTKS
jgi:tRNA(His) 5'-end guanylyltransferase